MIRPRLFDTFLSKPAEVHAFVAGLAAGYYGREEDILALVFGGANPQTRTASDVTEQGWYALAGLLAADLLSNDS